MFRTTFRIINAGLALRPEGNAFIKLFDALLGVGAVTLRGQGSYLKIRASKAHVVVAGVIPVWNVGLVQMGLVKITYAKAQFVKESLEEMPIWSM